MKKLFVTLLSLLIIGVSISQPPRTVIDSPTGTTLEEWNYISKGLKIQMESGLDMKKGYNIGSIGKFTFTGPDSKTPDDSWCDVKALFKEGAKAPVAYVAIIHYEKNNYWNYIGIPINGTNGRVFDLYHEKLNTLNDFENKLMVRALARVMQIVFSVK